jgi:hypothetical protein
MSCRHLGLWLGPESDVLSNRSFLVAEPFTDLLRSPRVLASVNLDRRAGWERVDDPTNLLGNRRTCWSGGYRYL